MKKEDRKIITQALVILDRELKATGPMMSTPQLVHDYLRLSLAANKREVFAIMFLDAQHRLIQMVDMFTGTIDGAAVYPREVVRLALDLDATALIIAHNHPSGIAQPSQADRRITERLQAALALIDIRILDHIIVSQTESFSFAQDGLL